jgi:alpha-L-rhamnosidase
MALILSLLLGVAMIPNHQPISNMKLENLRCEYQVNPLGIDSVHPRLSWWIDSSRKEVRQTAYHILVASSSALLKANKGDVWDSGKVSSDASIQVEYRGRALTSNTPYFWKVRSWDEKETPSDWSRVATWQTGLLNQSDWKAKWIQKPIRQTLVAIDPFDDNPAPLFRKSFTVDKQVSSAVLSISGLGYFEPRLNGAKVGDHQLDPGWTDFAKQVSYQSFDVTKQLHFGKNAIGVMLGNGFFNPLPLKMWGHLNLREQLAIGEPRLIAQLDIRYSDGTNTLVVSDESWRVEDGPVIRNSIYLGEVYDARKEVKGWDLPEFDDRHWSQSIEVPKTFNPRMMTQGTPPIRITKVVKPIQISEPKPGVYLVDFGQNFAGVTRMKVKGSEGTRVRLRSGELLYEDGTLNGMTAVTGQAKGGGKDYIYPGKGEPKTAFQLDEYVCRATGIEVFQPHFTFHGFRYVEVTGYPGKPTLADFEGLRMNSDVEQVGSFECSNPMLNKIQTMIEWTLLSNIFSVQSDCPHREKFGYGGDQVAASEMAMYTFNMARFYGHAVDLLAESQRQNGGFTETAPYVGIADEGVGGQSGPVAWGTAYSVLLSDLETYYGAISWGAEQSERQKMWNSLLESKLKNGLLSTGLNDHESLVGLSPELAGTAFYYLNLVKSGNHLANNAKAIQATKARFNERFLDKKTGKYDSGTQASQAFSLAMGLVPSELKAKAVEVLIKDIEAHDYHLTTGIFGTKYVLEVLSEAGRDDIAYRIANQRTFPSWGHMIEKGATTVWEHWEYSDNTFSHNHPMFGSISEWFYKSLAGIQPDPAGPGFKKFIVRPSIVGDLTWVKAHHDSMYGRIESSWRLEGNKLTMTVVVPPNTSATVFVPGTAATDSGKPISSMVEVGSGTYVLSSTLDGR